MRERKDNMQYKAVFFDFDYTLGDGTKAILAGFQHAFSKMGLPQPDSEAVRRTVGMPLEEEYTLLSGDASPENRAKFRVLYTEKAGPMQVETAITGGDLVKHPKPDPEGLLAAISAQGLAPEQVLYCGDTIIDAETAQRAGAHFCAVLNGTTSAADFAAAGFPMEHVAPDLWDLKDWLGLN